MLREAVSGILNDQVRLDRRKKGFNASINSIVDFSDKNVRDFILEETSDLFTFIDRKKVEKLILKKEQPNHFSKFIFNLLNVKIFLSQH